MKILFRLVPVVAAGLLAACSEVDPPAPDSPGTEPSPDPAGETSKPESAGVSNQEAAEENAAAAAKKKEAETTPMKESTKEVAAGSGEEIITLAGGCFWCTEAVLEKVEGVKDVVSGYMGGHVENPTYEQICTKTTGHAEVIQVTFDTSAITLDEILDIFWQAHDPTTLNQQGADRGPQYRSAIFYHSPEQKATAEKSMAKLDASGYYSDPAVTEITAASTFWVAEDYHQDYYQQNKDKDYCRIVITPKMKKLGLE